MPNAKESSANASDSNKPFKVKDVTRNIKKAVCASSLEEIRQKVAEKFDKNEQQPTIHLDSDGTEIDDEEYFRTLDENTELVAVFPGEHWIDPTHYVTITTPHTNGDTNGEGGVDGGDTTDANNSESARIRQLVGQLQNNLCNVSVMNDADLDKLSNMDPNSLVDITGKEFMEQLKDAGRPLCAKRNAEDRLNLLKLLKAGAIFCSERYPEDAEAIDREIGRLNEAENGQVNATSAITTTSNTRTIEVVQCDNQNTTITITVGEASSACGNTAAAAAAANEANANEGDI